MLRREIYLILLLSVHKASVHAQFTTPRADDSNGYAPAAADSYGLGVRIGVYCQTLSYLLGFVNLLRLEVRSQLTGIILGFQLMIRWSNRMFLRDLSPAEAWIVLAEALIFITPGIWLLALVFEAQRARLNISRRKIVRGQSFNIVLLVLTTFAATAANVAFCFFLNEKDRLPVVGKNMIWSGKSSPVDSTWTRVIMREQAILLCINIVPATGYTAALALSVKTWWTTHSIHVNKEISGQRIWWWRRFLHRVSRNARILGLSCLVLLTAYCVLFALSIELTIKANNLTPVNQLTAPGQLIPFLTGVFAVISATGDFFRRSWPGDESIWDGTSSGSEQELRSLRSQEPENSVLSRESPYQGSARPLQTMPYSSSHLSQQSVAKYPRQMV